MTTLDAIPLSFPPGFVWGTAASAHQAEGNNVHSDWWEWEQQPGRIKQGHRSGACNNFWERFDADFALLAQLGFTQHRVSVEWARIEPDEGRVDVAALRDGVIDLPGRAPEPVDDLRGAADFFGANYYAATTVEHRRPWGANLAPYPPWQARLTQNGLGVYPEGLRLVLQRVRDAGLGVPIYVTENGIGTDDDAWRTEYLRAHLRAVQAAIADGCDVRGYFHWTAVDNFKWHLGWTARFGLIRFDPATFERRPKPSARILGGVARANALGP